MDADADYRICRRCDKVAVVNPAGLCPRCQHQAEDAAAKVKPCVQCGSVEGRPDPRNGRIKRSRGLCSVCYDAWWDERRAKPDRKASPGESVAACVECGTFGGYVDPRTGRPKRTQGRCHLCYAVIHNARRRKARLEEKRWESRIDTSTRKPPDLATIAKSTEAMRQAHAPKIRTRRQAWCELSPAEASRRVRRLWRKRPAVEAFFASDKLIYD